MQAPAAARPTHQSSLPNTTRHSRIKSRFDPLLEPPVVTTLSTNPTAAEGIRAVIGTGTTDSGNSVKRR